MRDSHKVEALAAKIRQYFLERDFRLYASLFHRGTRWDLFGMRTLHRQRVGQKYIVTPYSIDTYSQPQWEIFDTFRFEPEPTHSIQMSLKFPEDDGLEELYFACAPANGEYKICDYVSRQPNDTPQLVPEFIDLAHLFEELRTIISGGIQAIGSRLGIQPLGFMRLDYSVEPYPCAVSLYPYLERLDERLWQRMVHIGGEYLHSHVLAETYKALIEGTPQLLATDGTRIDLAQDEFDSQFPDWIGETLFKEQIKKCMVDAFADCLASAHRQRVYEWTGRKTAVVSSHEELVNTSAPLRQRGVVEDIAFYEFTHSY